MFALEFPGGIHDLLLKVGQLTGSVLAPTLTALPFHPLAFPENLLKWPHLTKIQVTHGPPDPAVRAEIVSPNKPRNQLV